jgi:hypothetical protein
MQKVPEEELRLLIDLWEDLPASHRGTCGAPKAGEGNLCSMNQKTIKRRFPGTIAVVESAMRRISDLKDSGAERPNTYGFVCFCRFS